MQRARTYRTQAAEFLSALFLCLAAIVAGSFEPLDAATASVSSSAAPVTGGVDARDQQSSPITPKRPFVVADWRTAKAAVTQADGKSKAALPPVGPGVPDLLPATEHDAPARRVALSSPFLAYAARAPPASS